MFATHIAGEILLTTSTHQIILFKDEKVYSVNLIELDRPIGQTISTNVYQIVLLSWQIAKETTARILSKTAYHVTAHVTWCSYG